MRLIHMLTKGRKQPNVSTIYRSIREIFNVSGVRAFGTDGGCRLSVLLSLSPFHTRMSIENVVVGHISLGS